MNISKCGHFIQSDNQFIGKDYYNPPPRITAHCRYIFLEVAR